jgi:hypothetical protein
MLILPVTPAFFQRRSRSGGRDCSSRLFKSIAITRVRLLWATKRSQWRQLQTTVSRRKHCIALHCIVGKACHVFSLGIIFLIVITMASGFDVILSSKVLHARESFSGPGNEFSGRTTPNVHGTIARKLIAG